MLMLSAEVDWVEVEWDRFDWDGVDWGRVGCPSAPDAELDDDVGALSLS
jgi:hypothetical protein